MDCRDKPGNDDKTLSQDTSWPCRLPPRRPSADRGAEHDHGRPDRGPVVQVDRVLVDHADAAGGDAGPDGRWLDRPVDAEERVLTVLPEVHGARAERVAGAARHADAALQLAHLGG